MLLLLREILKLMRCLQRSLRYNIAIISQYPFKIINKTLNLFAPKLSHFPRLWGKSDQLTTVLKKQQQKQFYNDNLAKNFKEPSHIVV